MGSQGARLNRVNHTVPTYANRKITPRWVPETKVLPFQVIKALDDGVTLQSSIQPYQKQPKLLLTTPECCHMGKCIPFHPKK